MAVTLARLGRFLRSIFAPATAIISFSCILTFIFVLYQPHAGPGALQRLGWQSWDSISDIGPGVGSTGSQAPQDETEVGDIEVPSSGDLPEGVDWWNVAAPDNGVSVDPTSLPLDIWDPLMPHDTGRK